MKIHHPWIMFFFKLIGYHLKRSGARLKLDVQGQGREWKNFGCRWTRLWDVMKTGQFSWTSYEYHPL